MYRPDLSEQAIKSRAKVIAELIKKEFDHDVSHGQCLKIVSQLFGFDNYNTAKAMIQKYSKDRAPRPMQLGSRSSVKTVGELKKLLSNYEDAMEVVINDYDYVEPDWESDGNGGGYYSGPAGWLTKVYSLELEPAHNENPELVFDLRFESEDWSSGAISRELNSELEKKRQSRTPSKVGPEKVLEQCEKTFNEGGLFFRQDGKNAYLTVALEFDLPNQIHNSGKLNEKHGVKVVGFDRQNRPVISEDNGPGKAPGNKEGFIDELKSNFREKSEADAGRFFEKYGFSNQISEWEDNTLNITAQLKLSDSTIEAKLHNLLYDDQTAKENEAGERWLALQEEIRRGK